MGIETVTARDVYDKTYKNKSSNIAYKFMPPKKRRQTPIKPNKVPWTS